MNNSFEEIEMTLLRIACLPREQALSLWHEYRTNGDNSLQTYYRYLPAIYRRLDSWNALTPEDAFLRTAYVKMWSRNQSILNTVLDLTALLDKQDIPIMFIKSSALMLGYQIPTGYRYITDIDFAVPRNKLADVIPLLKQEQWKLLHGSFKPYYVSLTHSYDCQSVEGARCDIHWKVHHQASSTITDACWSSALKLDLPHHSSCYIPTVSDLFHLVCYHGGRRMHCDRYWAIDACLLLSMYGDSIDWDKQRWYLDKELLPAASTRALLFLHDELAANIPESMIEYVRHYKPAFRTRLLQYVGSNPGFRPRVIKKNLILYTRSDYVHEAGFFHHLYRAVWVFLGRRKIRTVRQLLQYVWNKITRTFRVSAVAD